MLSILIPVYNFQVAELVAELYRQAETCRVPFEILLMDDASTLYIEENRKLAGMPAVRLVELPENIGRARIRNRLADEARFDCLLFMDCDVRPTTDTFIQSYLAAGTADYSVIYGGRTYSEQPPGDRQLYLHWFVGRQREAFDAAQREQTPNKSFMTNNFLIRKDVFNLIRFDERIAHYGHEDTLFGFGLKKRGIAIHHIDNPLEHIGLEPAEQFLAKTRAGIENLCRLAVQRNLTEELAEDITLLKYYQRARRLHLTRLFSFVYKKYHSKIAENLTGSKPSLQLFDLYKLTYLCQFANRQSVSF